jgi:hypothetical protein
METTFFRKPSALLPIAMSAVALLLVVTYVAVHGAKPQADEGAAARIWQLLMVGQVPVIAYFGLRWAARAPRSGMIVLVTQLAAAAAAALPVFLLRF